MRIVTLALALLAHAALLPAQSTEKKEGSSTLDWATSRANDVLTGFSDLDDIGTQFAAKAGKFSGQSQAWSRLASDLSGGNTPVRAIGRAAREAAKNADKASKLTETATAFKSNPLAGSWGSRLARFGTPIAAMTGAATAWYYGDNIGAAQELANGAGSIKATAIGTALGTPLGPVGAVVGGVIGNVVYTYGIRPVTVDAAADKVFEKTALSGPEPWDLARKRIFEWLDAALTKGRESQQALQAISAGDIEARIAAAEGALDSLYARLDSLSAEREQACAAASRQAEAQQRFREALGPIQGNLEGAVRYETETCNLLNKMAGADPQEVARVWQGYLRYSAGRASAHPAAAQESLARAESVLAELRGSQDLTTRSAEIQSGYDALRRESSAAAAQAGETLGALAPAEGGITDAQRARDQASALVERARFAISRFLQHDPSNADYQYVSSAVTNQYGLLPSAALIEAERERWSGFRSRLDFVRQEAGQIQQTGNAASSGLRECLAGRPVLAELEAEMQEARENVRLTTASANRAGECRARAETYVPSEQPGAGGWDLSGNTETSTESGAASPKPASPQVAGLIRTVASAVSACNYQAGLAAVAAIEAAAPDHPWLANNRAAIAELRTYAPLDLNQALRRAEIYLSTGNDTAWAQALAPFLQAGCTAPALQQHIASASQRRDGRGSERESLMSARVSEGYAQSNRNAAAMRSATSTLMAAATAASAARQGGSSSQSSGASTFPGSASQIPAVPGASTPAAEGPATGQSAGSAADGRNCMILDRARAHLGASNIESFILLEYGEPGVGGAKIFDLIPLSNDGKDFDVPHSRVVGRYTKYSDGKAALERACPPSRRRQTPGLP